MPPTSGPHPRAAEQSGGGGQRDRLVGGVRPEERHEQRRLARRFGEGLRLTPEDEVDAEILFTGSVGRACACHAEELIRQMHETGAPTADLREVAAIRSESLALAANESVTEEERRVLGTGLHRRLAVQSNRQAYRDRLLHFRHQHRLAVASPPAILMPPVVRPVMRRSGGAREHRSRSRARRCARGSPDEDAGEPEPLSRRRHPKDSCGPNLGNRRGGKDCRGSRRGGLAA